MAKSKNPQAATAENDDESSKAPSFEDAMLELQQIVSDLEDNSLGLESSLAQFEKGIGLLRKCHSFLESAEQKIEILVAFKENGEPRTAPFDASPTAAKPDPSALF